VESTAPKNITISKRADEICQTLKDEGLVDDAKSAYKLAIAVALNRSLKVDKTIQFDFGNKWDTPAVFFDRDSNLEPLLLLHKIKPEDLVIEGKYLAEAGLRYIEEKRLANVDLIAEFGGFN
jgi:hypothetical protein